MALPYFHSELLGSVSGSQLLLDETTSKHIVQVLRMKAGERLLLTDGKGLEAEAVIAVDDRKRCEVEISAVRHLPTCSPEITLCVSLLKNTARFEWLLEKAAELGINQVIPVHCTRSEKASFKKERFNSILVSAMLQSRQAHQTRLAEPQLLQDLLSHLSGYTQKLIAHCLNDRQRTPLSLLLKPDRDRNARILMLIGPEGDFTPEEIAEAVKKGCEEVSLGENRLRTETAAITAAVLLRQYSA